MCMNEFMQVLLFMLLCLWVCVDVFDLCVFVFVCVSLCVCEFVCASV